MKILKAVGETVSVSVKAEAGDGPKPPPPETKVRTPGTLVHVSPGNLAASRTNPRKSFPEASALELAESVRELGVKQALLVRPLRRAALHAPDLVTKDWRVIFRGQERTFVNEALARRAMEQMENGNASALYEIVCGERRWRAASAVKAATIPCLVEDLSDADVFKIQIVENIQREGLSALEEAEAYQALKNSGMSMDQICQAVGKKRSAVFAKMALLKASPAVLAAVKEGTIEASVAELIGRVPVKFQSEALKIATHENDLRIDDVEVREPRSYRQVKILLEKRWTRDLKSAAFETEKDFPGAMGGMVLVQGCYANACKTCPMRTGNAREDFPDIKNPNICTNVVCFEWKTKTHVDRLGAEWHGKGFDVLPAAKTQGMFWEGGELKYGSGFVKADASDYIGGKTQTYAKALGDKAPKPVIAFGPDGEAVKLFKQTELDAAIEKAKLRRGFSGGGGMTADEKKKRKLKETRLKAAAAAVPAVLAHLESWKDSEIWHAIAEASFRFTSIDCHAFVAKRRGLCRVQGEARDALEKFLEEFKANSRECRLLALELLLAAHPGVSAWDVSYGKDFKALCDGAKVDLKKLEEEVKSGKGPTKATVFKIRVKDYEVNKHDVITNPCVVAVPLPKEWQVVAEVTVGCHKGKWFTGYMFGTTGAKAGDGAGSCAPAVSKPGFDSASLAVKTRLLEETARVFKDKKFAKVKMAIQAFYAALKIEEDTEARWGK